MPFQVNIQRKEESRQQSGNSPFESFLTAAFGTFLAVLLAWRFLLSSDSQDDQQRRELQSSSSDIAKNKHGASSSTNSSTKPTATTSTSTGAQPCRCFADTKNEFDNRHASNITAKSSSSPSSSSISNKGESSSQRPLTVQRLNLATLESAQSTRRSTNFMDIDQNSLGSKLSDDSGTETDFVDLSSVPPCLQRFSMFQMNDNDEVSVVTGDDDVKSDSSSERCELGILPAYLDTITEEDTDDLNTNSSGRSSPTRITRILNVRDEFRRVRDLQLSIETKSEDESSPSTSSCDVTAPSTPRNSNLNLNYFNPTNTFDDQEHNRQRSTTQQASLSTGETGSSSSAATINELQIHEEEELILQSDTEKIVDVKLNGNEEILAEEDVLSTTLAERSLLIHADDGEIENNKNDATSVASAEQLKKDDIPTTILQYDDEFLLLQRQIENRPVNLNYSIVESISTLFQEHYGVFNSNSSKNYRHSSSPTTMMEYDLRKASRRFERYGHIYKDAPKSGMEEFDPKSNGLVQQGQIRANASSTSLNNSTTTDDLRNEEIFSKIVADQNGNKNGADVDEKRKLPTQMASDNLNLSRDKNISVTTSISTEKLVTYETGRASSQSGPTFQPRPTTSPTTTTTAVETTTTHSTSFSSPTCAVCGSRVFQSSAGFKCRLCESKVETNNSCLSSTKNPANNSNIINNNNNSTKNLVPTTLTAITTNIRETQLDDWSFSDDEMSSTSTNEGPSRGLVIATATSKAIINDPAGQKRTSLIAAASANAVSKNPYLALARATANAASKVSEVVQHAVDPDQQSKVSLVVSSTVCATGKDLKSYSRENIMFETEISSSEPTPELAKKHPRYHHLPHHNGDVHSSSAPRGTSSTKVVILSEKSPERKPKSVIYQTEDKSSSSISPTYFRREEVKMAFEPQPERIYPPTTLREVETERKLIAPQHVSSDRLQKLVEPPYFAKEKSKENVGDDKTKSNQPTAPLSERNVNLWSTMPENSRDNKQNLMRWRNSMNLAENEELRKLMEDDQKRNQTYDTSQLDESDAKLEAKLISEKHKRSQEELDEEIRKIRRNKYKAKIDKAKKEYLESKASISDLYKDPEEFERKFKVSIENVRLPEAPRGPFLEYLGKSGSLHTIKVADVKPFYYKPDSLYDNEYESIVRQAERLWAPYRKRENGQKDNLYTHGRSTGYLETNFDGDEIGLKPAYNGIYETDLDEVIKVPEAFFYWHDRCLSYDMFIRRPFQENEKFLQQQQQRDHESRSRTKSMTEVKKKSRGEVVPPKNQSESHVRARSADYLADRKAREEIEPPENQLKKILGDKDETELSEHELRFRKSTEKLPVPGWYLNSEPYPMDKPDITKNKSSPSFVDTSEPSSPEMVAKMPHVPAPSSMNQNQYLKRGQSPSQDYRAKSVPSAPKPTEHTRYVSPWSYGGKFASPLGSDKESERKYEPWKPTTPLQNGHSAVPRSTSEPKTMSSYEQKIVTSYNTDTHRTTVSQFEKKYIETRKLIDASKPVEQKRREVDPREMFLPKDFFAKYRDEIEELRKSRSSLSAKNNNESNTTITYRSTDEEAQQSVKKSSSQTGSSNQAYNVPVATVRPSNHLKEKSLDNHSLTSTDYSSGGTPPPRAFRPSYASRITPPRQVTPQTIKRLDSGLIPMPYIDATPPRFNNDYSDNDVVTSTPYSSDYQSQKTSYEEKRPHYLTPPQSAIHQPRNTPGWTISAVPPDWNIPGLRESVVIEVSDQFFDSALDHSNKKNRKLGIPLTLEEALDSLLNLPTKGQRRLSTLDESSASLDTPMFTRAQLQSPTGNLGIYTHNAALMEECKILPEEAEELLKHETLWVRCTHCGRVRQLADARYRFVSCHHCYTYYCGRSCRKSDWYYHKEQCNYARINTLCKDIILKVRQDPEAQWQMSRVARQNYSSRGRGSVNFRFRSPFLANKYVKGGWSGLSLFPGNYLSYYTVPELVDANKEPNLINLCRRYDPQQKFILSVSIMAEIEEVPETPPPEREKALADARQRELSSDNVDQHYESQPYRRAQEEEREPQRFERSRSVPSGVRKSSSSSGGDDAKSLLKSVLRSMENIAPGPVYISSAERTANSVLPLTPASKQTFDRGYQVRHPVANGKGPKPVHYNSSPMVWSGPSLMAGNEDADESEV